MKQRCGIDLISSLPDNILTSIISRLSWKESTRTTILSKKWHSLFNNLAVFFNNGVYTQIDAHTDQRRTVDIICDMIRARGPPFASRCGIDITSLGVLNTLLFSDIIQNVFKEDCVLEDLLIYNTSFIPPTISDSLWMCHSLVRLEIHGCLVKVPFSGSFINLINLRYLKLSDIVINQYHLQHLVSICCVLEDLRLESMKETNEFIVSSNTLLSLTIDKDSPMIISLKDAPQLKQLKFCVVGFDLVNYGPDSEDSVVQFFTELQSLEVLKMEFENEFVIQDSAIMPRNMPEGFLLQKMKQIHVVIVLSNDAARSILRCLINSCPNLKELIVEVVHPSMIFHGTGYDEDEDENDANNEEQSDREFAQDNQEQMSYWELECNSANCVEHSLENVYINRVNVDLLESIGLINFFLHEGRVLQTITVAYDEGTVNESAFHECLMIDYPWASENLIIKYVQLE